MFRRTRGMGTTADVDGEHELRVEAALLGITRRLQDGYELQAATSARLRHALKRLEAAADALESAEAGGQPRRLRVVR